MSKASGLFLIGLGIGAAVYAMPYHTDAAEETTAALETSTPTQLAPDIVKTAQKADEIIAPVPKPAVRLAKVAAKPELKTTAASDADRATVVTIAPYIAAPVSSIAAGSRSVAVLPGDKAGIARELQRELRRVGCYDGEINGSWTPLSRRAMKAFTDRVNASLPVDQPDYILLTLVQGRQEKACGAPCPDGQAMSGAGRCLPSAVLAISTKKAAPTPNVIAARKAVPSERTTASAGWSTTATAATSIVTEADASALDQGRMGLAGPRKAGVAALTLPEGDAARLATAADPAGEAKAARSVNGADEERANGALDPKSKGARDKKPEQYSRASRKKFGTWFFRQQDAWNN